MSKTQDELISIPAGGVALEGALSVPESAKGMVIFAHGSGSSSKSPRNVAVAEVLSANGFATLLLDLLTAEESKNYDNQYNIELLASKVVAATDWVAANPRTAGLNIGCFGASTGAGAALAASVKAGDRIKAIVSRGGRPDLARKYLAMVTSPTLLIVGGADIIVMETNVLAYKALKCVKELVIIPGATHLFSEPGTLEAASSHALRWFIRYLCQG